MHKNSKFVIVGWGIAGATLAWHFHKKNVPVKIYDSGRENSSRVAAGLVNPIVFKRLTKSWNADRLIPYAEKYFNEVSNVIGKKIISNRPILRVFSSVEEQNNWSVLEGDSRFEKYVRPVKSINIGGVEAPFHVGEIQSIGNVNTVDYLEKSKVYLSTKGVEFCLDRFNYNSIDEQECYIFCEGVGLIENPYFNYLPLKPTHGDILTIKTEGVVFDEIINKNMFILPLGNSLYKIGATYNWEMTEAIPTERGKEELVEKLRSFTTFDFEIVKHQAGIRPTVSDRRPLLGKHPEKENLFIFNGLGTKGVMIAPYYAEQLLNFVLGEVELDSEVNIERHFKHYNR